MTLTEWKRAAKTFAFVSDGDECCGHAMVDPEGSAWITGGWSSERYVDPAKFHVITDLEDVV